MHFKGCNSDIFIFISLLKMGIQLLKEKTFSEVYQLFKTLEQILDLKQSCFNEHAEKTGM